MISHEYKCIFLHIEKNAGTSIEKHLLGHDMWNRLETRRLKHLTAKKTKEIYAKYWNNYFKFSIIRNPWDRWVSYYSHFLHYEVLDVPFYEFTKKPLQSINNSVTRERYETFLTTDEGLPLLHCSQKQFLKNKKDEIEVDFICRFENLQQDYSYVCDEIGADIKQLGHEMETKRKSYHSYYDAASRDIVERRFKDDVEYFNYKF